MKKRRFFSHIFLFILFIAMSVVSLSAETTDKAMDKASGKYEVFSADLRELLPPVVADFVERFLYERVNLDEDAQTAKRRMDFDEVVCSFPLDIASLDRLRLADGISVVIDDKKVYNISWYSNGNDIGQMSFPASFDLLLFTNQVDSFNGLVSRLRTAASRGGSGKISFVGHRLEAGSASYRRNRASFFLGHLDSHTYHDSITGRPLWTDRYPAESLANLFVYEKPVADVLATVDVVAYTGERTKIELPVHELKSVMDEMECEAFFGVSEMNEATGDIEALVVYHNPDLQYLHKLEVKADSSELWDYGAKPRLHIKMNPFIKLHNLTNLWGDKK